MEDSLSKSIASKGKSDGPEEESGWTSYFEDFLSNQTEHSSRSDNKLVSDAASCFEWKVSNKLNFKKTRTKQISRGDGDDSLEDTASSPVNSPTVGSLEQMDINQRKNYSIESSLGKGGGSDHDLELQTDDQGDAIVFEERNNNCTDLRKRGLCLVPLSMLVNYLG